MGLTDTQREIVDAIRTLTSGWSPIATVSDIAEKTGLSEQAIRNNMDDILDEVTRIDNRKVGQTTVYFEKTNLMDEIEQDESTIAVANLSHTNGQAGYVALRFAPEDSPFDLEAHWYDWNANRDDSYRPTTEEIGQASEMYATDPLSIKYWDTDDVEFDDETSEDDST